MINELSGEVSIEVIIGVSYEVCEGGELWDM